MNSTIVMYVAIGLIAGMAVEHFTHVMDRFIPGGM
jgi:hypothetical protein